MEGISNLKIIGIDEKRPPVVRKEPYIDLYFKLSHKAPPDWCNDFNARLAKHPTAPKVNEKEGMYIEAWVRVPEEIPACLEVLKTNVAECTRQYIQRIEQRARNANNANLSQAQQDAGPQGRLNKIIAALNFEDIPKP